jgi:hypothetical protein
MLIRSRKFDLTTEPHITYTPCYMQCGFIVDMLIRRTKPFCFIFVGRKLKFEYLYIE